MKIAIALLALSFLTPVPEPAKGAGCVMLAAGDVVQLPHGYLVRSLNHFVEYDDALPSGDDRFWICTSAEGPLALYAPPDPAEHEGADE